MPSLIQWALSLIIPPFLKSVMAQSSSGFFVVPSDQGVNMVFGTNEAFTVGDQVDVKWVTDKDTYSIVLWQQSLTIGSAMNGQPVFSKVAGSPETGTFQWTVDQQTFDLNQSNVFFFACGPMSIVIDDNIFTSHYFNLTEAKLPSTRTSMSSASPMLSTSPRSGAVSSLSSPTPITIPLPANTTLSAPNISPTAGLNNACKAALGVGLGFGILLLLVIVYLVIDRSPKAKEKLKQLNIKHHDYPLPPFEKPLASAIEMSTTQSYSPSPLFHSYRNYNRYHDPVEDLVELPVQYHGR